MQQKHLILIDEYPSVLMQQSWTDTPLKANYLQVDKQLTSYNCQWLKNQQLYNCCVQWEAHVK